MGYGWEPYVPVAQRRANALRKIKKLKEQGAKIQPIEIEGKKIALTFWGKAWCEHIESFSDYENRLPRGRSYMRNGSVCHLAIEKGKISAIVSGSSLYNVEIKIEPLSFGRWSDIKKQCSGQIGSLIELLNGNLSDNVMNIVCHRQHGLFPTPSEIHLSCSCPDWATMCKHVAAVLYGVAVRLDHSPQQLFLLRAVNHEELIDVGTAISRAMQTDKAKHKHIVDSSLEDIFGIEIENKAELAKSKILETKTAVEKNERQLKTRQKSSSFSLLTGENIRKKRKSLGLTQSALANILGVSQPRISKWERSAGRQLTCSKRVKEHWDKLFL